MIASNGSSAEITVAAVLVNWRQPALTSEAVASLERQTGLAAEGTLPGIRLRVVIVDNGSGDGSLEELRERHPQHLVVDAGRNGGFGAGVNAGIRACPADAYVLLNNDAVAEPGFVAALVRALWAEPAAGAVTARIVLQGRWRQAVTGSPGDGGLVGPDGALWRRVAGGTDDDGVELLNSTGNEMTRSGNGRDRDWLRPVGGAAGADRPAGEVFGFCGGAAVLRASALGQAGLFDESLFMYYEDTELSWRLRRGGWSIRYEPTATARHAHAASSGTGSEIFRFSNERNRMLVALRTAPARVALTAAARTSAATVRSAVRAALRPSAANRTDARRRARSLGSALRLAPANLRLRARIDRRSLVPRSAVAEFLVDD
ncbi:glycosyltransferase family 2 protein [Herbiconiux sp. YIM B11900]|uniref:glycosyltransferase family 2 protein n=1 Tax=Herbiconiux sp. YIM B11900 TaxID=3404131 RepID=UPI003F86E025